MQNFRDYLETKRIVTKKRVPYYVAWVSQFFNYFDKKPNDEISSEEIEKFLKHLTKVKNPPSAPDIQSWFFMKASIDALYDWIPKITIAYSKMLSTILKDNSFWQFSFETIRD